MQVLGQIGSTFPIRDRLNRFEVQVSDLDAIDNKGVDDLKGQHEARTSGRTWSIPVKGTVKVIDLSTNKPVLQRRVQLATIPKMTRHYSYIVGGSEKFISNQWRLRPGVYVKSTEKEGEFEAQFQLAKGKSFDIQQDSAGYLFAKVGARKVPLYSILHSQGISDDAMRKAWGDDAFKATRSKSKLEKDLNSFHEGWVGVPIEGNPKEAIAALFQGSKIDPSVVKANLGIETPHVTGELIFAASKKLVDVSSKRVPPDPIDSLRYKELWQAKDHLSDRLAASVDEIRHRVSQALGKPKLQEKLRNGDDSALREIVMPDLLKRPLYHIFTTSLSGNGKQTNPVSMLADHSLVTIAGPGGIQNVHAITKSNTAIDPSSLGVLDPVFTPESNPGINTHLSFGVNVKDRKPYIRLFNTRTGRLEDVDAGTAAASNVVLPDQVTWRNGKPTPRGKTVRMSDAKGDIHDGLPWAKAHYVMPTAAQVFTTETNLVPFMQNDSAGRSTMSARHMSQAISIEGREAPLVQVEVAGGQSFERLIGGGFLSHRAESSGTVVAVRPKDIVIKGKDGKIHSVQLYDHYPTNDPKGMLHSTPLVKEGDKVRGGQIVADNNYTKNGILALGTNLRAAYLANGSNHEDGIVISESAAHKLRSVHLNKPTMMVGENTKVGKALFAVNRDVYTDKQISKIGDDGVIRKGTIVQPGDPLILALNRNDRALNSIEANLSRKYSAKLRDPYSNGSMVWDHDVEGEVIDVARAGRDITVHVKTREPMQVGAKLSTRHSAKGIITSILPDKEMPHDASGKPVQILINPLCYDEETEFLTHRGWVRGTDLLEADVFGTMNPASFVIEWQRASGIVKAPYRGKMYKVQNLQVDLLVTPNHRMFTAPRVKGATGTLGALDLTHVNPEHFTDATAEEIVGQPRRYLKAGLWTGVDPGEFMIPQGTKVISGHGPAPKDGAGVPTHLWAEFMGWFLSEGYTTLGSSGKYLVGISQSYANPEKREQIKELLESMGLTATETSNGYQVCHKGLYELLEPLGGAADKYIPRDVLDLPPEHLRLFLDAFIAGDGNTRWEPEHGRYGTRRLSSNSKKLIDGLQEICIKLGFAANIGEDSRTEKYRTGHHYTMSLGPRCSAPWVNWSKETKANQVEEWVDYDGMVYCCTVPNTLLVVRRNGVPVISGNSVPGRMNPGQILETAAAKIAEKTGKPYLVRNFQGGVDYLKKIQGELKAHGLTDTEVLYDPKSGRRLGNIMVGPHYVFQLEHQIDKKTHVRSGGPSFKQFGAPPNPYDNDTKIPKGGGHAGAQSLGSLGVYAAIAAGLHSNLSEMQTIKSDQDQATEVWGAITEGKLLPPPKIPFVYHKFEAMMKGLGVNLQKEGSYIRIVPKSDAETRATSSGELTKASKGMKVRLKGDEQPEKGGLFDQNKTGGLAGHKWSHIELVEPMPNPTYAKAIAHTLGIKEADISDIIEGKKRLPGGQYGGKGFREALSKLDIDKELKAATKQMADPKLKGLDLDKVNYKIKALQAVKKSGYTLSDAWTIQAVPVLPPMFRTQSTLPDGTLKTNPLNSLYRRLALNNESLRRGDKHVPYDSALDTRAGLYKSLTELFGTSPKGKKGLDLDVRGTKEDKNKKLPGILHMIAGDTPKDGFFQDKLIGKKQDYTARSTIVVDPNLSIDEIGVPKKIAMELLRPMVARRLITGGYSSDQAQRMVSQKHEVAVRALQAEVAERPILLKRDPILHQYGLIGQRIKLTDESAIKLNPLVLPPLNADIDGDAVALMVPLTHDAVHEAKRIMPSSRMMSDSSGELLFAPANEAALSIYRMSIPRGGTGKSFKTAAAAEKAFYANQLNLGEAINLSGVGKTTLGRIRMAAVVPESYRHGILTNLEKPLGKKEQAAILKDVALNHPADFVRTIDSMSQLGFKMAYESGHTISLKDLEPLRAERAALISKIQKEVAPLEAAGKHTEVTEKWLNATRKLHDIYKEHGKLHPTNVSDMAASFIKAKREQFQGLVMAPMLVEDHLGHPSRSPVTTSFAEGIDIGGYFLQAAGARRGTIQKVDSVRKPGYMTKLLIQSNIDQPIMATDCGTHSGISMPITDKDIIDRYLAQPVKIGNHSYAAGSRITPSMVTSAAANRVGQFVARSPLKCRLPHGICSHCMGVHPSGKEYAQGENVGIIASQALGERAAQIMLRQMHGGGIVSTAGQTVAAFGDVQQLYDASKPSLMDGAIAPSKGTVTKVTQTKSGVWNIHMAGLTKPLETRQKPLDHIKAGVEVARGDMLTHGDPNIWHLNKAKGIDAVQQHMVKKIGDIYASEGVLRRHVELTVRTATGLARITDVGDHDSYQRGDHVQRSVLDEINRTALQGKKPIQYESVLSPLTSIPDKTQTDWIGRLQGENIVKSITKAVQHGQTSNLQGRNPIPRLAEGRFIASHGLGAHS